MKTLIAIIVLSLALSTVQAAEGDEFQHRVRRGDTLWDICEHYYGDPGLWPKLWQMNPFVTNPHLLRPGDRLTLLAGVALKTAPSAEAPGRRDEAGRREFAERGIRLSALTQVPSVGSLETGPPESLGWLAVAGGERRLLASGETVYVRLAGEGAFGPGDLLAIGRFSPLLKHPVSGARLGFLVSVLGRLKVKGLVSGTVFEAQILESYRPVQEGDGLLRWDPPAGCVRPAAFGAGFRTRVVALKDSQELVAQSSVVYLEHGSADGLQPGQLFEAVAGRKREAAPGVRSPEEVLGHVLVVSTRTRSAAGVVLSAIREFPVGTALRSLGGAGLEEIVGRLPSCPIP